MEKKIIVLAGNRKQFEDYLDDNSMTDSQAVYGWSPEILHGIQADRVEIVGTFWGREDAYELRRLAESRIF